MSESQGLKCPICKTSLSNCPIEPDNFRFLSHLESQGLFDDYISVCRVYLDILNQGAAATAVITNAVSSIKSEVSKTTSNELNKTSNNLIVKVQEALRSQTLDPKLLETLARTLPELTLAIHELLKKQYIPQEKGKDAEKTLHEELTTYYPEDEVIHLGGASQTDIIIQPRSNGMLIGSSIIVESKSNKAWSREYLTQTRRYMALKKSRYAILSLDTMPKGANGYITEYVDEGVIFITERSNCKMVYGALKAILFSEHLLDKRIIGLQNILADSRIQQAMNRVATVSSYFESVRKRANSIITSSKAISQDVDDAEQIIKACIIEMQKTINETLEAIPQQSLQVTESRVEAK